jgi:hypothetical protein
MKRDQRQRPFHSQPQWECLSASVTSVTSAPARADIYQWWHIKNYTAAPMWGHFELQNKDDVNRIEIKYERPLQPGATTHDGAAPDPAPITRL